MELPFVFDCVDVAELHGPNALLGTAPIPAGLADHMHAAWIRFAAEGSPGWPPQGAEPSPVHVIGVPG